MAGTVTLSRTAFAALVAAAVTAGALTGCASATRTSPSGQPAGRHVSPPATTPRDEAARDASAHLEAFAPPSGSHQLTARPAGATALAQPTSGLPTAYDVADTAWWQTTGTPQAVIGALATPAGSTRTGETGSGSSGPGGSTGDTSYGVEFDWPPESSQLASRRLEVTAQAVGPATVLRVDATSTWVLPRDPSNLVPITASSVTITLVPGRLQKGPATYGPVLVNVPAQVGAIIAAVNTAPIDTRVRCRARRRSVAIWISCSTGACRPRRSRPSRSTRTAAAGPTYTSRAARTCS